MGVFNTRVGGGVEYWGEGISGNSGDPWGTSRIYKYHLSKDPRVREQFWSGAVGFHKWGAPT